MKRSRKNVRRKATAIPTIRFEDHSLTSCSGLVVFQALFSRLRLTERLERCLRSSSSGIYGLGVTIRLLIVHLLLGYRELRDCRFYEDDVLVKRLLGLNRLPDVSTISRELSRATQKEADRLRRLIRELVLDRLEALAPARLTLDFDGSVQSTKRHAEGTAVGFNKKKKGARSYYPLFCTISQTGQVFDVFHRSGNVHDSNGAKQFILACLRAIRDRLPRAKIEVRVDSAFFSDEIVTLLDEQGVEFTVSVPFERFVELKDMIEARRRWKRHDDETSFFETSWKPKKWDQNFRFVFVRSRTKRQSKDPVQFNLFVPYSTGYDFKVIVTNKRTRMKQVMVFHNGRGSQERTFAELKSQAAMDYVPSRRVVGNQLYRLCAILAHNLARELQMRTKKPERRTTENRAAWWRFETLQTLRRNLLCRAGRLTRPRGELTLTMNANGATQSQIESYLAGLRTAA